MYSASQYPCAAGSGRRRARAVRLFPSTNWMKVGQVEVQTDLPCGLLVDLLQQGQRLIRQDVCEGVSLGIGEGERPASLPPGELDTQPPLLG